jgi:hypothetical protein
MKTTLLRLLPLLALFAVAAHAAEDKIIAAVRAADDERIAATKARDRARLEASYSDDLHYAHSNGRIDTKVSQLQGVTGGTNRYDEFEHKERIFTPVAPGVVLMRGHVLVHMSNATTGEKRTNDLNYLAVWREEKGKWRFLAWQSCPNPAPAATAKK